MKKNILVANGFPVAVYDREGTSPPVFFVHGIFSNAAAWQPMLQQPGMTGIRAIALDLPGHGASGRTDVPEDYGFLNFSSIVAAVLERLDLHKVILVGHSIGGHVAMHVSRFTDRVAAIMIVAAVPLDDASALGNAYNLDGSLTAIFGGNATDEILCDAWLHGPRHLPTIKDSYQNTHSVFQQAVTQNITSFLSPPNFTSEKELLVNKRVAFVYGEEDKLVRRSSVDALATDLAPAHEMHFVAHTAHFPHLEAPAEFGNIMRNFIDQTDASSV